MLAAILSLVQQIYKYITTTVTSQLALIVSQTGGTPVSNTIGGVPRVQLMTSTSGPDTGFVNVVNFSGVGRLRGVDWIMMRNNTFEPGIFVELKITIDGTVLCDLNISADGGATPTSFESVLQFDVPSSSALFANPTATSTRTFLDLYFKSSLLIQQRVNGAVGGSTVSVTTTVEYEHS